MQGIEILLPIFLQEEVAKIQSPFFLRRMDYFGKRFYYEIDEELNPTFYLSTTTFIKSVLPESQFLTSWKIDVALLKGNREDSDSYVQSTADYGTMMHICIGEIVRTNKFNWSELTLIALEYASDKTDPYTLRAWMRDLMKDLLAFCQWVKDYNVNVFAVEFPIKGENIATCIDLVAELDLEEKGFFGEVYLSGANKGQPKETKQIRRVKAIIDLKSGRKGFYDSHEAQLELCKEMWNEYFLGTPYEVQYIYNWSPKDWISTPGYNFKDQTNSRFKGKTKLLFDLADMYKLFNFERFMVESGDFELGQDPVFQMRKLEDKIKEYENQKRDESETK